MDRQEAHKALGLYLGASNSQIDAKLAELEADARTRLSGNELESRVHELRAARDTALGRPTIVIVAPTRPPLLRRGPVVVLMIFVALAVVTGMFFLAAAYLDKTQAERKTGEQRAKVVAAHDAWFAYRASAGIGETPDGERADAVFNGANLLFAQSDFANAADDYTTALQLYNSAFAAEDTRITQAWQRDVLDFRGARLTGRFPFDPDAEAEAKADDVALLLNPGSGALWAITREFDALAAIELEGRHFATPLKLREELEVPGRKLREALFGEHSPTIDLRFKIRVSCTRTLAEIRLEAGGVTCSSRKEGFLDAHWIQSAGGVKLTRNAVGGDTKDATLDLSDRDWGMLRVLAFGVFIGERDGGLVWEFNPESIGGKKVRGQEASIHIRLADKRNPFDLPIYSAFVK